MPGRLARVTNPHAVDPEALDLGVDQLAHHFVYYKAVGLSKPTNMFKFRTLSYSSV